MEGSKASTTNQCNLSKQLDNPKKQLTWVSMNNRLEQAETTRNYTFDSENGTIAYILFLSEIELDMAKLCKSLLDASSTYGIGQSLKWAKWTHRRVEIRAQASRPNQSRKNPGVSTTAESNREETRTDHCKCELKVEPNRTSSVRSVWSEEGGAMILYNYKVQKRLETIFIILRDFYAVLEIK